MVTGQVDTFTMHLSNATTIAQKWGFVISSTVGKLSTVNSGLGATTAALPVLYHKTAFAKTDSTFDVTGIVITAPATPGTIALKYAAMAGTNATGSSGHSYKGTASITVTAPLPITLASFATSESLGKVNLSWSTSTELNVASYNVERSTNSTNFVSVGKLAAYGNSISIRKYAYTDDASKLAGTVYYRLSIVDKDGKITYSAVQQVVVKANKNVVTKMYPNPLSAGQDIKLAYTSLKSGVVNVQVLNSLGKQVVNSNLTVTEGSNTLTVSGARLAAGIYYVSVTADNTLVERLPMIVK